MSRQRILSATGIQSLEPRRGYRDGIGYTIDLRWKGTQDECGSALEVLVAGGGVVDADISPDSGGYYILSVAYATRNATTDSGGTPIAGAESVVTTWSRETSSLEKSLWELGPIKDAMSLYGTDSTADRQRAEFRSNCEKFFRGELTLAQLSAAGGALTTYNALNPTAQMVSDIAKMFDAFSQGIDTWRTDLFVIKRVQVGAPTNLANNDATNNMMWNRSTLIAQPTMPSAFQNVVPPGYFLQYAAEINVLDNSRWQVSQMWQWVESYNVWIWGAAI